MPPVKGQTNTTYRGFTVVSRHKWPGVSYGRVLPLADVMEAFSLLFTAVTQSLTFRRENDAVGDTEVIPRD